MRHWSEDGYLLLRQVFPRAAIDGVRASFERAVDRMLGELKADGTILDEGKELPLETRYSRIAGRHANRFGRSWRKRVVSPEVFHFHRVPALVGAIAQLTGTDVIGHPIFNARPKLPGQQLTTVPWHQDSSYFGDVSSKSLIISVWAPLVPVDAVNGCLQVVKGSHHVGLKKHVTEEREGKFLEIEDGSFVDESKIVTCDMAPGDALLFTNLTLHRSLPNSSSIIRWSLDIRYLRDGDHPGTNYWAEPGTKWTIRSSSLPETTLEQWLAWCEKLRW